MKTRWLAFIVGATACASTEALLDDGRPDDSRVVEVPPPPDSGPDAAPEADVGPCDDCEYFPDVCSPDALCLNGPFDATTAGGGLDSRLTINTIQGRSVNDVWAAGELGAVAHFDGTSWKRSELGSRDGVRALWLRDSGEVALSTFSRVYTRNLDVADAGAGVSAGGWTFSRPTIPAELTSSAYIVEFASAWGAPGGEWLWCAAMVSPERTSGLWRVRHVPSSALETQAGPSLEACKPGSCYQMKRIHGASADELWAVGEMGSAVLVTGADGDTPSVKGFNTQTRKALNGVWVASASDAWAVGASGTVRHYTGDPMLWDVVSDVPTTDDLRAVWGSSSADIWAVGDAGLVLHYDGKSWSRVKIAGLGRRRPTLTTVWVPAPGHVWVGGQGVILSLGGKP